MIKPPRLRPLLLGLLVAAAASGAQAAEEPVATASPSTAEQIDAYLRSSPTISLPREAAPGVIEGEPERRIHGEVSVAVGSHGYRSAYMRADVPLGETGTLSVAIQQSRMSGGFYPWEGRSLGLGLALGEAATAPYSQRCRTDWDHGRLEPRGRLLGSDLTCRSRSPAWDAVAP